MQRNKDRVKYADGVDANTIDYSCYIENGINLPTGYTKGFIIVSVTAASGALVQRFQGGIGSDNVEYIRSGTSSGSFTDWMRTDNFGYNTLDELAAALKPLMQ